MAFPEPLQFCGDEPDPYPEGRVPPSPTYASCDHCGRDAFSPVTNPVLGVFCSRTCHDTAEAQFVTHLQRLAAASGE